MRLAPRDPAGAAAMHSSDMAIESPRDRMRQADLGAEVDSPQWTWPFSIRALLPGISRFARSCVGHRTDTTLIRSARDLQTRHVKQHLSLTSAREYTSVDGRPTQ
jgi:hypothetical protein